MEVSKKVVMAYARALLIQVRESNPTFTPDQMITHTVEGVSEKYLLDYKHSQMVMATLSSEGHVPGCALNLINF